MLGELALFKTAWCAVALAKGACQHNTNLAAGEQKEMVMHLVATGQNRVYSYSSKVIPSGDLAPSTAESKAAKSGKKQLFGFENWHEKTPEINLVESIACRQLKDY